MENETCMEYLFHCIENNHAQNINQDILFNASNEFRNVWNLVKKMRDLARVDVKKITNFLDAVQDGLENGTWSAAIRNCLQADNEYRHIRRYIRPSFLDDFKVSLYLVHTDHSKCSTAKREKKHSTTTTNGIRKQNFRNKQINKQNPLTNPGVHAVNEDGGKKLEVKKPKAQEGNSKSSSNENKSNDKKSTNVIHPLSDGINKKDKTDKENVKESDGKRDESAKTFSKEVNVSSYRKSNTTEKDCRKSSKADETIAESQAKNKKNIISYKSDTNVIIRQDGDGSIRSFQPCEKENIDKNTSNNPDIFEKKEHEDTIEGTGSHRDGPCNSAESVKKVNDIVNPERQKKESAFCTSASESASKETHRGTNEFSKDSCGNTDLQELVTSADAEEKLEDGISKDMKTSTDNIEDDVSNAQEATKMVTEQMATRISFSCKQDDIITELNHIYDTDWNRAYTALTQCRPSNGNKNTIDFLGEILKVSASDVKKAIETSEVATEDTVSVQNTLKKLKKDFLSRNLKQLQKEHSIVYRNGMDDVNVVNLYSAKCVELSWFMHSRSPPMEFDYDSRPMLLEDLLEIFKPYKNEGHCIHYIVWPAIRRSKQDTVVAQGIAEFR